MRFVQPRRCPSNGIITSRVSESKSIPSKSKFIGKPSGILTKSTAVTPRIPFQATNMQCPGISNTYLTPTQSSPFRTSSNLQSTRQRLPEKIISRNAARDAEWHHTAASSKQLGSLEGSGFTPFTALDGAFNLPAVVKNFHLLSLGDYPTRVVAFRKSCTICPLYL